MKKYFLSILLVALSGMSVAQVVQENESAVVYYMPKNELLITVEYDRIEQQPGVFYQYAERYLEAKDIILSAKTSYVLKDIHVDIATIADTERPCKVNIVKGTNMHLLTLSQDGRWLGYNIPPVGETKVAAEMTEDNACTQEPLMPLLEEHFMASSVAKMAEGAAKQIYRIRETRLNILAGDVEHVPADGNAMKQVLDELNKQEQMLVELFIGTQTVVRGSYTIRYTPGESVEDDIICRFSQHNGVVSSDDLSGEPIYLTLQATRQALQAAAESNSKAPAPSPLCYNLPGKAEVTISFKNNVHIQETYAIAQYGVSIPMAQHIFVGRHLPVIHINPQTGNIQSIQQ